MFSVANAIAYENMMVYATIGKAAPWFGDSCWIDVPASNASGHWIPAQGDLVDQFTRDVSLPRRRRGLHRLFRGHPQVRPAAR